MAAQRVKQLRLSFKNQVKNDLCAISDDTEGCLRAQLSGLLAPHTQLIVDDDLKPLRLLFHTDNKMVAEWAASSTERLFQIAPQVSEKELKNGWTYELSFEKDLERLLKDLRLLKKGSNGVLMTPVGIPPYFKTHQAHLKAYLRGVFLSCGAIADPEKVYRLELTGTKPAFMQDVMTVLSLYGVHLKLTARRGLPVLWTKEAESVIVFLNLIGAHKALLGVENIRAYKEVRNVVNRRVNCDLANLKKTTAASEKQLAIIHQLELREGLENLPIQLKDLALLRKQYPEMTIQELGSMMDPPIGKSAVFKRFEKMEKILKSQGT